MALGAERGSLLVALIEKEELDLALACGSQRSAQQCIIGRCRAVAIGTDDFHLKPGEPTPLIALDPPCSFRSRSIEVLEKMERHGSMFSSDPDDYLRTEILTSWVRRACGEIARQENHCLEPVTTTWPS